MQHDVDGGIEPDAELGIVRRVESPRGIKSCRFTLRIEEVARGRAVFLETKPQPRQASMFCRAPIITDLDQPAWFITRVSPTQHTTFT